MLHDAIVRLFPSAEDVRIITTNYDRHLVTAAENVFGTTPHIYCAPALPLGRDFNGIVSLHGCIGGRLADLVITSSDFGQAYLTDAWATRLLLEVFAKYVTLFVGYSHDDVVMSYLAQGLRAGSNRFGFLPDTAELVKWRRLEIEPIIYPQGSDHGELTEAIVRWGEWRGMGQLEHESKVRLLAASGPPIRPTDVSYLERVIGDDLAARFFAEHATSPEWLDWIVQRQPFPHIFESGQRLSPAEIALSAWFCDRALSDPEAAMGIVEVHGGHFNAEVATRMARLLPLGLPESKVLGRWLGILMRSDGAAMGNALTALLSSLRWPDDRDIALSLLEYLTRPRIELRPRFNFGPDDAEATTEYRIDSLMGDEHLLPDGWDTFFRPHLSDLASDLAALLEGQLSSIHRTLRSVGQASDRWDTYSFLRSAIEPHPQDHLSSAVGFLIDALRDCLENLVNDRPEVAGALLDRWGASGAPNSSATRSPRLGRTVGSVSRREASTRHRGSVALRIRDATRDLSAHREVSSRSV